MTNPDRTPDELRIAERYLRILDDVSHCAQVLREGDWRSLADEAGRLARNAAALAEAAGKFQTPATPPRAHLVVDTVSTNNQGSQIAKVLHPVRLGAIVKTTMTDPFTHPGVQTNR